MSYWDEVRDPKCKACPLHETARRVANCTGSGHLRASVVFLGEAPGEEEEKRGRPFVGRAGRLLLDLLEEAEWELPYAITNTVWCRPPKNRKPHVRELEACIPLHMWPAIDRLAPKVILCLGATAFKAVTGNTRSASVKQYRRRFFDVDRELREKKGTWRVRRRAIKVTGTYHPAAVFRNPSLHQVIVEDLRWIQQVLLGKLPEEEKATDRTYVLEAEGEDQPLKLKGPRLAIDLETTGLSPWARDARILSVGVSNRPLYAQAFAYANTRNLSRFTAKLRDPKVQKIGHNLKFDLVWLKKNSHRIAGPVWDTQVAWHLIAEEYPDQTLEHLAQRFTPMGYYSAGMKEKRGTFTSATPELLQYNALDADATYRLAKLFRIQHVAQNLRRPMRLMMRTLRTLVDVEVAGMQVDVDEVDLLSREYGKRRARLLKSIRGSTADININSTKQLSIVLFDQVGLPALTKTKTGMLSTSSPALEKLLFHEKTTEEQRELLRRLLEYRKLLKLETAFLRPLREEHVGWDCRVHPSYRLTGTVTGRLSCAGPNLQQVPKETRSVFVSRYEGGSIVQADFSQMELRVLAMVADEPRMLEVFEKNGDIHRVTASRIFRVKEADVTPDQRALAKTINFGILYGMQAGRLAGEAHLSYEEAQDFLGNYWHQYPQVAKWVNKIKRKALVEGRIRSLFGRIRHITVDDPQSKEGAHALRQAVNFPIQSDAAAITLVCMNTLWWFLRKMKTRIVATVHDSIVFDCPPDELDHVMMLAEEVCENPATRKYGVEITVPLKVEIGFGPNWRDLKSLSKEG